MKYISIIIGILILSSCGNSNERKVIPKFKENELSFLHLRFGYDKSNKWIKNSDNILMLHETLKKIGYINLINNDEWEEDCSWWLDVKKSPKHLIDSLEITFENYQEAPKYYREFWQRRFNERNDEMVYKVVSEIKQILIANERIEFHSKLVNDTLFNLMNFEHPERELSDKESNELLNYLIEIELHESAYNLVSGENGRFTNTKWEKEETEILNLLKESEANQRPWFADDTK